MWNSQKLSLALLDNENPDNGLDAGTEGAVDLEETVDKEIPGSAEMNETVNDSDTLIESTADLDTAATALSGDGEGEGEGLKNEELTEAAQEAYIKLANSALRRAGGDQVQLATFAKESFGTSRGRESNRLIAYEGVVEKAKVLWTKIISWIEEKLRDFAVFIKDFFSEAKSVNKQAESIAELCGEKKGKELKKDAKLVLPDGVARTLVSRGASTLSPESVESGLSKLVSDSAARVAIVEKFKSAVSMLGGNLGKSGKDDITNKALGLSKEIAKIINQNASYAMGGFVMQAELNEETGAIKVVTDSSKLGGIKKVEPGIIDPEKGKKLADEIGKYASGYSKDHTGYLIEDQFKAFKDAVKSAASNNNVAAGGEVNKVIRTVQGQLNAVLATYNKDRNLTLRIMRAVLVYVRDSMKQYK